MVKRYEQTEALRRRLESLLPDNPGDPGKSGADNRHTLRTVAKAPSLTVIKN